MSLFISCSNKGTCTPVKLVLTCVSNVLIIALDQGLASFLDGLGVAYWLRQDAAKGSHKISAQKFKFMDTILAAGASVLVTDIVGRCPRAHPRKHQQLRRPDLPLTRSGSMSVQDVVYVQDPFKYLHRDSDLPPWGLQRHHDGV